MAESLESRKFERKTLFDVPLPIMKRGSREGPSTNTNATVDPGGEQDTAVRAGPDSGAATGKAQNAQAEPPKTMAFSLMTKRGNKQQVRSSLLVCSPFQIYLYSPMPDPYHRSPLRLKLRPCPQNPAAGRARRTTAYQKLGS